MAADEGDENVRVFSRETVLLPSPADTSLANTDSIGAPLGFSAFAVLASALGVAVETGVTSMADASISQPTAGGASAKLPSLREWLESTVASLAVSTRLHDAPAGAIEVLESMLDVAAPQLPWRVLHQFFDTLLHAADGSKKSSPKPAVVDQVFEAGGDEDEFDLGGYQPADDGVPPVGLPPAGGERSADVDHGAWIAERGVWRDGWPGLDRTAEATVERRAGASASVQRRKLKPEREQQTRTTHHAPRPTPIWCRKSSPCCLPADLRLQRSRCSAIYMTIDGTALVLCEGPMTAAIKDYLSPQWWAIADCVDAYETQSGNGFPNLRSFVERLAPPDRVTGLAELVKIELELRWRSGDRKQVEDFLREYPELKDPSISLEDLAAQEALVRSRCGDPPSVDELQRRFPMLDSVKLLPPGQAQLATIALADSNTETKRSDSRDDGSSDPGTIEYDSRQSRPVGASTSDSRSTPTAASSVPAGTLPSAARVGESIGRYAIRQQLGAGSFGVVLRCFDADLKRDVAIKLPHQQGSAVGRPP